MKDRSAEFFSTVETLRPLVRDAKPAAQPPRQQRFFVVANEMQKDVGRTFAQLLELEQMLRKQQSSLFHSTHDQANAAALAVKRTLTHMEVQCRTHGALAGDLHAALSPL